jgi:hypothetical protein
VLLFFEFAVEHLGIIFIKPDKCVFLLVLHHLSETAATGLQHHILRAGTLLGQDDTGKALAVPTLFANLCQQDDFDVRQTCIKRCKLEGCLLGHSILFVAAVVFQDAICGVESTFGYQLRHEGIDIFFQMVDAPTIDS